MIEISNLSEQNERNKAKYDVMTSQSKETEHEKIEIEKTLIENEYPIDLNDFSIKVKYLK